MQQPINYKNLLQNKCPKCAKNMVYYPDEEMIMCSIRCGFMIHKAKMESICMSMTAKKIETTSLFDNL